MTALPALDRERVSSADVEGPGGTAAWIGYLLVGIPVSAIVALIAASAVQSVTNGWAAFGVGCGVIAGAAATGSLLGFLFGIPRSLQGDKPDRSGDSGGTYGPNTNLEQISDWLTKILVGVGLVEIKQVGSPARSLVASVGSGMGNTAGARVIAAALLVVFLPWGFLLSYLITRTQAARAFRESDVNAITQQAIAQVTETLDRQAERDARLLTLIDQTLNPGADSIPIGQTTLDTAMADASGTARLQAFLVANRQRRVTWRADKTRMAATIPIFRALIASDRQNAYHRNHAQLGYALKDLEEPQWREAFDALSEAISRRRGNGYLLYEFNRAITIAELIEAGTPPPDSVSLLDHDLNVVARSHGLWTALAGVPSVAEWIAQRDWRPA